MLPTLFSIGLLSYPMQSSGIQEAKEPHGSRGTIIIVPMQNLAGGTGTGLETKEEPDSNRLS